MLVYVVNNVGLARMGVVDDYEYLIWNDKFCDCGDFELSIPYESRNATLFQIDRYITVDYSDRTMVIESIILNNSDGKYHIIVKGRSLESILERRVFFEKYEATMPLNSFLKDILNKTFIAPDDEARKISNMYYSSSPVCDGDEYKVTADFSGENVLTAVKTLTNMFDLGFSVILINRSFRVSIEFPTDRTLGKSSKPIIFSPNMDTLFNSNFIDTTDGKCNVAYCGGGENWANREYVTLHAPYTTYFGTGFTGLTRREMYISGEITKEECNGNQTLYHDILRSYGMNKFKEYYTTTAFEGEINNTVGYEYGTDYKIGDIVTVDDGMGNSAKARIVEYIISDNEEGLVKYPTFEIVEEYE